MAGKPKTWIVAHRRPNSKGSGGAHCYINTEVLNNALKKAGIPLDAKLMIKRHAITNMKNTARIIVWIRERDLKDMRGRRAND